MLRQTLSCNLGPHPCRILNRPAKFAVRLGLIAAAFQFGFDSRLIKILYCHREVRDVGFVFRMLAFAKIEGILAEFEEAYRAAGRVHTEHPPGL